MTEPDVRAPRSVRVRTEVAALAKTFDYLVPEGWMHDVRVGTRVRVPLHGRSVRGWVVGEGAPLGIELLPLKSWLGWGPPDELVELADWAAWRWAGPPAFFLRTASPETIVRALPRLPPSAWSAAPADHPWSAALAEGATETVVRLPPATDLIDLVSAVIDDPRVRARDGSVVVLVPSVGWADRLVARLERRDIAATRRWEDARAGWPVVVGTRAGAWAPVPRLAAAIVLDAHDAAYREESAPTYSAVEVLRERARRSGAPCLLVSPIPPVELTAVGGLPTIALPSHEERAGWPALDRVDRRAADPRSGMFSEEFVRLARSVLDDGSSSRGPLVCVYNRTGGARLLACAHCGKLAQCSRCSAAVSRARGEDALRCPRCGETRPVVCPHCGRLRMKVLRVGVSRLREEIEALLGVGVAEVSGASTPRLRDAGDSATPQGRSERVVVGTEAVLHRVRRAAAVAFLDIDLHLLAPRVTANEDTLAFLVRAGRLVGARATGPASARVLVQTRVPGHPVLVAAAAGEPSRVIAEEADVRRASSLPPFTALALVSGSLAPAYADALAAAATERPSVSVGPLDDTRFLVQAPGHRELCDFLADVERPAGRGLRVEVDPTGL